MTDVLIVGAGLTGLKAAMDLQAAGVDVSVLEARNRVGGRACSVQQSWQGKPTTFDLGAHFIGDEAYQAPIWDLVTDLGIAPFPQYDGPGGTPGPSDPFWFGQGANLQENAQGGFDAYIGTTIPSNPADQFYLGMMQSMVDAIPTDAPWSVPQAPGLDALSVEDWVGQVNIPEIGPPTDYFKGLVRMLCRVGFSCEARDISMLWLLFYVGSSGGLARFQAIRWPMQGAQGYRLPDGAQSIAEAIVARLKPGTVKTGVQIMGCRNPTAGPVQLVDFAGQTYTAKAALFAMAPKLYAGLTFQPPLPAARSAAAAAMDKTEMFMTFVRFDTAFWRQDTTRYTSGTVNGIPVTPTNPDPMFRGNISAGGLSGDVLMLNGCSVWIMDNCSYEGAPALFAFIVGDEAVRLRAQTKQRREAAILKRMTDAFGAQVGQNNPVYTEMDWNAEVFSAGCPAGHFGKGGFLTGGAELLLSANGRAPVGNLFFASTETASLSNGYMSGAVWSGTQIAITIQDFLAGKPPVLHDDFSRAAAMRYCVKTILGAIAAQNPMLEWPVIADSIVFHGPGGKTLGGDFPGEQGTVDFYTLLGLHFTITRLDVESIVTDVEANRAYAYWTVSGTANSNGAPFHDVKGTMIFEFTPRGQSPVKVAEDWLLMDTAMIDALASGTAPPPDPTAAFVSQALRHPNDFSWLDAALVALGDDPVILGPGGQAVPTGPYQGLAGLRTVLKAFSQIKGLRSDLQVALSDTGAISAVLHYQLRAASIDQPLVITARFGNEDGHPLREIAFQTDGSAL